MCAILQAGQHAKPQSRHQLTEERLATKQIKQLDEDGHPCRHHGRAGQDA